MRSFLIIMFCANLFSGGILFGEIARIPALMAHYKIHQQENPDTTVARFLWLHYFDNFHVNDPAHGHHELPFHQHCGQQVMSVVAVPPASHFDIEAAPIVADRVQSADNFYYQHYLPVGFTGSVFQPPKA